MKVGTYSADFGVKNVLNREIGGDYINYEDRRQRANQIKVWMNDEEVHLLRQRMEQQHIRNVGAYMRKMALDGYCVSLDTSDIKQLVHLLRMCSNNLNQYAHKANATGNIYRANIEDLQRRLDQIWDNTNQILAALAAIQ